LFLAFLFYCRCWCVYKENSKKIKKRKDQKYFMWCGHCMSGWIRDRKRKKLIRVELEPKLESKSKLRVKEMEQERHLNVIFYPPRITLFSCFFFA